MLSPPAVWRQQNEFVSSRQSGLIFAAVRIGFECRCDGQNGCRFKCSLHVSAIYTQTNVGLLCCVGSGFNVAVTLVVCCKAFDLYSLPNIVRVVKSRRMRWAGHVARMGVDRGVYKLLVGKPEGKRPLGRPRRRWEDNIKMDLQEAGGGRGDWIELAQDSDRWRALVGTVRKFRVP
jgi:hypothetical protein